MYSRGPVVIPFAPVRMLVVILLVPVLALIIIGAMALVYFMELWHFSAAVVAVILAACAAAWFAVSRLQVLCSRGRFVIDGRRLRVRMPTGERLSFDLSKARIEARYSVVVFGTMPEWVICYEIRQDDRGLSFIVEFWGKKKEGIPEGEASGFYLPLTYGKLVALCPVFSLDRDE